MVPHEDYLTQKQLYTMHGRGIWRVIGYCDEPSLTLENIITHDRETFGVSGKTNEAFEMITNLYFDNGVKSLKVP